MLFTCILHKLRSALADSADINCKNNNQEVERGERWSTQLFHKSLIVEAVISVILPRLSIILISMFATSGRRWSQKIPFVHFCVFLHLINMFVMDNFQIKSNELTQNDKWAIADQSRASQMHFVYIFAFHHSFIEYSDFFARANFDRSQYIRGGRASAGLSAMHANTKAATPIGMSYFERPGATSLTRSKNSRKNACRAFGAAARNPAPVPRNMLLSYELRHAYRLSIIY